MFVLRFNWVFVLTLSTDNNNFHLLYRVIVFLYYCVSFLSSFRKLTEISSSRAYLKKIGKKYILFSGATFFSWNLSVNAFRIWLWGFFFMPKSYSNNQIAPNICVGIGACIEFRICECDVAIHKKIYNYIWNSYICMCSQCVWGMCGVCAVRYIKIQIKSVEEKNTRKFVNIHSVRCVPSRFSVRLCVCCFPQSFIKIVFSFHSTQSFELSS